MIIITCLQCFGNVFLLSCAKPCYNLIMTKMRRRVLNAQQTFEMLCMQARTGGLIGRVDEWVGQRTSVMFANCTSAAHPRQQVRRRTLHRPTETPAFLEQAEFFRGVGAFWNAQSDAMKAVWDARGRAHSHWQTMTPSGAVYFEVGLRRTGYLLINSAFNYARRINGERPIWLR